MLSSLPDSPVASGAELLAQNADSAASSLKPRLHLPYLDGIRAFMALYVMHHHVLNDLGVSRGHFSWRPIELLTVFHLGHYAVAVFIVLSGYCLMLPVLREGGTLRGGLSTFLKRRARRILPPYYAALIGGALLLGLTSLVTRQPLPEPFSAKSWVLHLLLLHNLTWIEIYDFNGALWSVATEWQIYFLFPFLFLPVWKRFGSFALLGVAATLGALLTALFPIIARGCPWFVALFALGMIAAQWSLAPSEKMQRAPWVWGGLALVVATYFGVRLVPAFDWNSVHLLKGQLSWYPMSDVAAGLATFCFLMHGTLATLSGRRSKFVSMLTWRPLVLVGAFSYSLYLIHLPVQAVALKVLNHLYLGRSLTYAAMMLVFMPLTVLLAYAFYLGFEKPFLGALKPK